MDPLDPSVMNQKFISFIAHQPNKQALTVSSMQNLAPCPPCDGKNITLCANQYIDTVFQVPDLKTSINTAFNGFVCLYYTSSSLVTVVKKHQMMVVKMISLKLFDEAIVHLSLIQQAITTIVSGTEFQYLTSESHTSLMAGIPFCPSSGEIVKLVVAFQFLAIQAVLKLFSQNLKQLVHDPLFVHPFTTVDIIRDLPFVFLNQSNFMCWVNAHPASSDKHVNNIITILGGLIAICEKVPSTKTFNSIQTKSQFLIKLWEFQYKKSGELTMDLSELSYTHQNVIETFYNELKVAAPGQSIPDLVYKPTSSEIDSEIDFVGVINQLENNPEMVHTLKNYSVSSQTRSLVTDLSFVSQCAQLVQSLTGNYLSTFITIITKNFAANRKLIKSLTREHYSFIDAMIRILKQKLNSRESPEFIQQTVSNLYRILSRFNETKRIRAIAVILSNLSRRSTSATFSYQCSVLSANIEFHLCDMNDAKDQKALESKVERTVKLLLDHGDVSETTDMLIKFLSQFQTDFNSLDDSKRFKHGSIIKLALKSLAKRPELVHKFVGTGSDWSDTFKAIFFIKCTETPDMSSDFKAVLQTLYQNLSVDSFLKSVVTYHLYKVEGLEDYPEIPPPSEIPESVLIYSGLLLFQNINVEWSFDNIKQFIKSFNKYLSYNQPVSSYETEIVFLLSQYLFYNGLHIETRDLLTGYLQKRQFQTPVELKLKFDLLLRYGTACLNLDTFKEIWSTLQTAKDLLKDIHAKTMNTGALLKSRDMLDLKIFQLQALTTSGETTKCIENLNEIVHFAATKPEFSLSDSKAASKSDKLLNLASIAKLNSVACTLQTKMKTHVQCYHNGRTGLKLALSLLKSIKSLNGDFELKWQVNVVTNDLLMSIIDSLKDLGVSRDIDYFIGELVKLNKSNTFPLRNGFNHFYLADTYLVLENYDASSQELKKGTQISELQIHESLKYLAINSKLLNGILLGTLSVTAANRMLVQLQSPSDLMESNSDVDSNSDVESEEEFGEIELDGQLMSIKYVNETKIFSTTQLYLASLANYTPHLVDSMPLLVGTKDRRNQIMAMLSNLPKYSDFSNSVITNPPVIEGPKSFQNEDPRLSEIFYNCALLNEQVSEFMDESISDPSFESTASSIFELREALSQQMDHESVLNAFRLPVEGNAKSIYFQDFLTSSVLKNDQLIRDYGQSHQDSIFPVFESVAPPKHDYSTFMNQIETEIPSSWTVLTLNVSNDNETLILTKLNHQTGHPLTIRLPLTRMSKLDNTIEPLNFKNASKELKGIISTSNESILPATTSQINTKEDRKKWWSLRFSLDMRIKELLESIEHTWLGGFCGIFNTQPVDSSLVDRFHEIIHGLIPGANKFQFDEMVVEMLLQGPFSTKNELQQNRILEDIVYFIADSVIYAGHDLSYDELNFDSLSHELKQLFEDVHESETPESHIVLIPDSKCSEIPWESLPCLAQKSISRMPSIHKLLEALTNVPSPKQTIDGLYLVNPGGDLKKTESRFIPVFNNLQNWSGIVGERPQDSERFLLDLLKKDLFVYIGHGGCEEYIKPSALFKYCKISLPPSLLIGCSSGALSRHGILDAHGNAYNWLNCGSPMVIANLWDVTDKDIDKFTLQILEQSSIISSEHQRSQPSNFGVCVTEGRTICNLRYLNGSAPIIYGLPLLL